MSRLRHYAELLAGFLLITFLGWHFQVSPTAIISVAAIVSGASLALTLSMQQLLQSYIAGRVVRAEGRFLPGDQLTCMGYTGEVVDVGWRLTTLRTAQGTRVECPNAQIFALPYEIRAAVRPPALASRLLARLGLSFVPKEEPHAPHQP